MSHHTRIVAIISFLLLTGAFAALVGGLFVLEHAERRLQEGKREIAAAQMHEIAMLQLSREFEETALDRAELDAYLLPSDGVVDFLSLIETLGVRQGVLVTTAALEVIEEGDIHATLRLEVRASGSHDGVLHVLETLESLPYASHVERVDLQTAGASGVWDGVFTAIVLQHREQ